MEFAHVRRRRRDRQDAAPLARDFSDLLRPLEPTTAPDVSTAVALWQSNPARAGIIPVMTAAETVRAFT